MENDDRVAEAVADALEADRIERDIDRASQEAFGDSDYDLNRRYRPFLGSTRTGGGESTPVAETPNIPEIPNPYSAVIGVINNLEAGGTLGRPESLELIINVLGTVTPLPRPDRTQSPSPEQVQATSDRRETIGPEQTQALILSYYFITSS